MFVEWVFMMALPFSRASLNRCVMNRNKRLCNKGNKIISQNNKCLRPWTCCLFASPLVNSKLLLILRRRRYWWRIWIAVDDGGEKNSKIHENFPWFFPQACSTYSISLDFLCNNPFIITILCKQISRDRQWREGKKMFDVNGDISITIFSLKQTKYLM